jgi:hypothetical protein
MSNVLASSFTVDAPGTKSAALDWLLECVVKKQEIKRMIGGIALCIVEDVMVYILDTYRTKSVHSNKFKENNCRFTRQGSKFCWFNKLLMLGQAVFSNLGG